MYEKKLRSGGSRFAERPLRLVERNTNLHVSNFFSYIFIYVKNIIIVETY